MMPERRGRARAPDPPSSSEGEAGCLFDEIGNLVEPTKRLHMEVQAGLTSHGWRGVARTTRPDGDALTTVHSANLTIGHKSVGTRWGGCVIRTRDPTLRIDRSQNHAHFNPHIRSSGDACRA
jgi:hypothetical protein